MNEQNKTPTGEAGNPTPAGGATFTQDEVNNIIGARLAKERAKIESDLADREEQLARQEYTISARKVLEERHFKYNADDVTAILGVLKASTVQELENALTIIQKSIGLTLKEQGTNPATPPQTWNQPTHDAEIRKAMGLKK